MRILDSSRISQILGDYIKKENDEIDFKSGYFYHLALLDERITNIKNNFPSNSLHAIAVKTNNLPDVLKRIVVNGCGLEAASFEEVLLAVDAGCETENIVFDSPVKTPKEIDHCNENFKGLRINANSFQELEKLKDSENLIIGIRINPMIEIDAPELFNVSGKGSKFGIPISFKERLLEAFLDNRNITGIHVHPGSEIKKLEDHISSISAAVDFANWINSKTNNQIKWIDIGGGLKAETNNDYQKSISSFVDSLKEKCSSLFSDFQIVTEYGRFVHQHCAFAVSRVEDILDYGECKILLIHIGADLFLREVYSANPPHHNFYVLNNEGRLKNGEIDLYDIGGPLCFSGDFLARKHKLPKVDIGDLLAIDMSGANSISMWSEHCSRKKPDIVYVDQSN